MRTDLSVSVVLAHRLPHTNNLDSEVLRKSNKWIMDFKSIKVDMIFGCVVKHPSGVDMLRAPIQGTSLRLEYIHVETVIWFDPCNDILIL